MVKEVVPLSATLPVEEQRTIFQSVQDTFIIVCHVPTTVILEWTVKVISILINHVAV